MENSVINGDLTFEEHMTEKTHITEYDFVKYDNFDPYNQTGPSPRVYTKIADGKITVDIVEKVSVTQPYTNKDALVNDVIKRREYFLQEISKMDKFIEHSVNATF